MASQVHLWPLLSLESSKEITTTYYWSLQRLLLFIKKKSMNPRPPSIVVRLQELPTTRFLQRIAVQSISSRLETMLLEKFFEVKQQRWDEGNLPFSLNYDHHHTFLFITLSSCLLFFSLKISHQVYFGLRSLINIYIFRHYTHILYKVYPTHLRCCSLFFRFPFLLLLILVFFLTVLLSPLRFLKLYSLDIILFFFFFTVIIESKVVIRAFESWQRIVCVCFTHLESGKVKEYQKRNFFNTWLVEIQGGYWCCCSPLLT